MAESEDSPFWWATGLARFAILSAPFDFFMLILLILSFLDSCFLSDKQKPCARDTWLRIGSPPSDPLPTSGPD